MMDQILAKLGDPGFLVSLLVSLGCATTVLLAFMPLLQKDDMSRRIKSVSTERERIRMRERERLAAVNQPKLALRHKTGGLSKQLVVALNLDTWLNTDTAKMKLAMAGFRGQGAENAFLAYRLAAPILFFIFGIVYFFFIAHLQWSFLMRGGASLACAYLGIKAPELFLNNKIAKRQKAMTRAYPNMVDLLIICAESGMSIEHAVRKVGQEVGSESLEMAEEMSLLAAEMSFLEHRRIAFENLTMRTGIDAIKQLTTVLIQSEKYGTPLGAALRVLAQESRDARLTAAEKKAAALPPSLTVPMIIFFLPGLFAAILTPAIVQINHWN
ncbi:MAG: type II secretion system F family protein [Pseudomonadota bacterium]|nr:type II secretion system F family protein [Pseudomonadota bacterium]